VLIVVINGTSITTPLTAMAISSTLWYMLPPRYGEYVLGAAAFQIGLSENPYKELMRQWKQRAGAFIFNPEAAIYGQVLGTLQSPEIVYPIVDTTGYLEPKTMSDMLVAVTQVAEVYKSVGAFTAFPNPNTPLKF